MYEYCFTLNIHTTDGLSQDQMLECGDAILRALDSDYQKPDGSGDLTNCKAEMDAAAGERVTVLRQCLRYVGMVHPSGNAPIPGGVTTFINNG